MRKCSSRYDKFAKSRHQIPIGEVPGVHDAGQGVAEDMRIFPVVEQAPHTLDPVGVHVADYPFLDGG